MHDFGIKKITRLRSVAAATDATTRSGGGRAVAPREREIRVGGGRVGEGRRRVSGGGGGGARNRGGGTWKRSGPLGFTEMIPPFHKKRKNELMVMSETIC